MYVCLYVCMYECMSVSGIYYAISIQPGIQEVLPGPSVMLVGFVSPTRMIYTYNIYNCTYIEMQDICMMCIVMYIIH